MSGRSTAFTPARATTPRGPGELTEERRAPAKKREPRPAGAPRRGGKGTIGKGSRPGGGVAEYRRRREAENINTVQTTDLRNAFLCWRNPRLRLRICQMPQGRHPGHLMLERRAGQSACGTVCTCEADVAAMGIRFNIVPNPDFYDANAPAGTKQFPHVTRLWSRWKGEAARAAPTLADISAIDFLSGGREEVSDTSLLLGFAVGVRG